MIHSFLLIGQSNAAGRGFLAEAEPLDACVGNLGDFLANCEKDANIAQNYGKVNEIMEAFAAEYPNCALASADGLGGNPDNLHFNAAALKEFGIRYYAEYKKFDSVYESEAVVDTDTERSSIESL